MRKETTASETFYAHHRNTVKRPTLDGFRTEISNSGGVTVAWKADVIHDVLVYSVARCSDVDNFNKKRGRDIARGRLEARKAHIITGIGLANLTPGEVSKRVIAHALANDQIK